MFFNLKWFLYIKEIKFRFFYINLSAFFTFLSSYLYFEQFIYILTIPLWKVKNEMRLHLIFTDITEVFFTSTKLSFYISFFLTFFYIFYQFLLFVKSGFHLYEKHFFYFFFFLSFFLTFLSLLITYFIFLPFVCKFFLSNEVLSGSPLQTQLEAKIYTYIILILNTFFWSYFIFQLPIFVLIFSFLDFFNRSSLIKKRRFFYFFFFFITVSIFFPDFFSQFLLFIFFFFFFEFSIYFSWVFIFFYLF